MKAVFLTIPSIFLFAINLIAQPEIIHLTNPSFESFPIAGKAPYKWTDCGFDGESPADTHPGGNFDVIKHPAHGNTYLGIVTRANGTFESIGQELTSTLIEGQCYVFKISLCRSKLYVSRSRSPGKSVSERYVNHVTPIKLVIMGANQICEEIEILGESSLISNSEWQDYIFVFKPRKSFNYVKLTAHYKKDYKEAYDGNLLVDNASPIIPITCDSLNVWTRARYEKFFSTIKVDSIKTND